MTAAPRLSDAALPEPSSRVGVPLRRPDRTGIVHLGAGAFFRAHQAVFTEQAFGATGDGRWGVLAVTGRRPDVADELEPQDGLYGVLERSGGPSRVDVIGSVAGAIAGERDAERVIDAIACEETEVVTLTITEKAYVADELSRPLLNLRDGLERRRASHGRPLTVISCDNLRDNGGVLRSIVAGAVDAETRRWMESAVAFPRTMVDRIVPATASADRDCAERLLGVRDAATVVAEPFSQWVIADEFAADTPAWGDVGAIVSDEVSRWEDLKIRTLNATHSLLAYEGALRGHATIAQCVADSELADIARDLMAQTALSFTPPREADLGEYQQTTLRRFANPGLGHTVKQIAKDGSEKVPVRLLPAMRDLRRSGGDFDLVARAVAAWMVVLRERPELVDDPRGERLRTIAAGARGARHLVSSLLRMDDLFDEEWLRDPDVVEAMMGHAEDLTRISRGD